jgi:hypothetical protein
MISKEARGKIARLFHFFPKISATARPRNAKNRLDLPAHEHRMQDMPERPERQCIVYPIAHFDRTLAEHPEKMLVMPKLERSNPLLIGKIT